jgi:phosphotriesterase-related protein
MTATNTVRGPVPVEDLGFTLMHEHVVNVNPEIARDQPEMSIMADRAALRREVVAELRRVASAGVQTLVDATAVGHGRDTAFLAEVNAEVDLHIIVSTGIYTFDQLPKIFHYRGPTAAYPRDVLTELFVRDIRDGIAGTGIRAGIIKVATDAPGLTPDVERALRSAAAAHRETGVPITTHTAVAHRNGLDQQRVFAQEGVDLRRVIIGHSGDSDDFDYLRRLLDAGSLVGADRFGLYQPGRPTREQRLATVARLCELGYAGQVVLSHDKTIRTDWYFDESVVYPEEWHQTHLIDDVLPALLAAGVTPEQVHQMTVENPRRVFAGQEPY